MLLQASTFSDIALLLLRVVAGVVFAGSAWNHLRDPEARSRSIGQSKRFTIFLGVAESLGSLGLVFGVLTRLAALGLILILLGAIGKKVFVWRTGFWGQKGYGWHYDLMLVAMCLVIWATGGGRLVLRS